MFLPCYGRVEGKQTRHPFCKIVAPSSSLMIFGLTFIPEQRLEITGIEQSQVQYEFLYFTFRVLNATVVLVSFLVCNIEG